MVHYKCPRCGYSTSNKSYFRKHLLRKKICKIVYENIAVEDIYMQYLGEPYPGVKMLQNEGLASTFCQHLEGQRQPFVNTTLCNITNGLIKGKRCYKKNETSSNLQSKKSNVTKQRQPFVNTSVCNIKNGLIEPKRYYENFESSSNLQNGKSDVTKQRQPFVNTCISEGENRNLKCYKKNDSMSNLQSESKKKSEEIISEDNAPNSGGLYTNNISNISSSGDIMHKIVNKAKRTVGKSKSKISEAKSLSEYSDSYSLTENMHDVNKMSNIEEVLLGDCDAIESEKCNISEAFITENDSLFEEDMLYECSYCSRTFNHRQARHRHEKKCNSRKVLENRCTRLEMALEQKEEAINQLRKQLEQLFDKVGSAQVHNHNTTNYTYNIILNAFGSENTSYIDRSTVKKVLEQGTMSSIPRLLELIHFHPDHEENHNVRITNKKENTANLWDGNKWILKRRPEVIEEMSDKAYNLINKHMETEGGSNIDDFKNKYDSDDKDIKKRVHQETELMIINNKKQNH